MLIKKLTVMAVCAASLCVRGLMSSPEGRQAYFQRVAPVVAQYQEVLSWED